MTAMDTASAAQFGPVVSNGQGRQIANGMSASTAQRQQAQQPTPPSAVSPIGAVGPQQNQGAPGTFQPRVI